jgi:hypothetical protein
MTPDCKSSAPRCTGSLPNRITGNRVFNLRGTTALRHTEINQHGNIACDAWATRSRTEGNRADRR